MLNVLSNAYISIDSKTYKIINFTIYEADMKYIKKKEVYVAKLRNKYVRSKVKSKTKSETISQ